MSHHNTAFHQLLQPLSRHDFEKLTKQHHAGQKLRAVTRWDQFLAMGMSQLAGRQSLRDIEASLQSQRHKVYHLGGRPIAKSSLSRVNEKQPAALYEALFHHLLGKFQHPPSGHGLRFRNPLYSLDASLIDLSLAVFPWAHYSREKAAMKLHVGLNHSGLLPEFVTITEGKTADLHGAKRFAFPRGSVVVCDKGYVDYNWYKRLNDQGVFFVTRLKPHAIYRVEERRPFPGGTGITSDQIIQLNSQHALKQGAPRLRRIGYRDAETGKHYVFLTNHFKLAARTIAEIYKQRWQVELFFKAIKQNLKIKVFVGHSKNAVLTQIWIALCIYLLLAYLKFSAKLAWSVQRLMRVLQVGLFERRSLLELINPSPPPDPKGEPQIRFAL